MKFSGRFIDPQPLIDRLYRRVTETIAPDLVAAEAERIRAAILDAADSGGEIDLAILDDVRVETADGGRSRTVTLPAEALFEREFGTLERPPRPLLRDVLNDSDRPSRLRR